MQWSVLGLLLVWIMVDLIDKIDLEIHSDNTICMDTRLNQTDSVATSNAKTQARQSLVYDQFNEENFPSWTKSNNLLGESLLSVTEVSFSWSACRNFSHLRNQPPPSPHWVGKVADYHQLSASFNNSITNSQSGGKNFCELCQFQLLPDVQFSQSPTRAQPWFREPKK